MKIQDPRERAAPPVSAWPDVQPTARRVKAADEPRTNPITRNDESRTRPRTTPATYGFQKGRSVGGAELLVMCVTLFTEGIETRSAGPRREESSGARDRPRESKPGRARRTE